MAHFEMVIYSNNHPSDFYGNIVFTLKLSYEHFIEISSINFETKTIQLTTFVLLNLKSYSGTYILLINSGIVSSKFKKLYYR